MTAYIGAMDASVSLRPAVKIGLILTLALCFQSAGQSTSGSCQVQEEQRPSGSNAEGSIAAAARSSKKPNGAHAKKVFSDEDMEAWSGPLPKLKMDGTENSDEIIAAIGVYHASHTPEQTEKVVRQWFERYDEILKAAIENSMEMQSLRSVNSSNAYELCSEGQNYQECRAHQIAAQRSAPSDQAQMQRNLNAESRIQQAFMRIRNALWMHNLRYEWFKVRTANGIDRF
jgi:hypothetical protein